MTLCTNPKPIKRGMQKNIMASFQLNSTAGKFYSYFVILSLTIGQAIIGDGLGETSESNYRRVVIVVIIVILY